MNNDLISREALKKTMCIKFYTTPYYKHILDEIDNAPTVAEDYDTGYQDGLEDGLNDIRPQGEWKSLGFVHSRGYAWCTCSKCGKTTKIYLDKDNDFCCIADIRNKAVACLFCGADMRGKEE